MRILLFSLLVFILIGNTSLAQDRVSGMDALIEAASAKTVKLLERGKIHSLAVYYFTIDGRKSGISDYLINGLTTEISNLGRGLVQIVSRQALDRIMEEYAFQMSDLADRGSQIRIGNQLGADLILTGFLTPVGDRFKLNAQLIEVETGVVRGGYILDFDVEKDFEKKILVDRESRIETIDSGPLEASGVATHTTILENFDSGMSEIPFDSHMDAWGERIDWADGFIDLDESAGVDGTPCVIYNFEASFDSDDLFNGWEDSDLNFYLNLRMPKPSPGADGIYLSVKPAGFSQIDYHLVQRQGAEDSYFSLSQVLNADEWQDLKIPFYNFYPDNPEDTIDPEREMRLSLSIYFRDNFDRRHFRTGQDIQGALLVDNVGFFKITGAEEESNLDSFDDDVSRAVFSPSVYGSSEYWDYSENENGVQKINQGITGQTIQIRRKEGGPAGSYLAIEGHLDVTTDLEDMLASGNTPGLFVRITLGKSWSGFDAVSFYIRSRVLKSGSFEIHDTSSDRYYYADVGASSVWSKLTLAYDSLGSEQGSLADTGGRLGNPYVNLYFDIPPNALRRAMRTGSFDFSLDLDEIRLE